MSDNEGNGFEEDAIPKEAKGKRNKSTVEYTSHLTSIMSCYTTFKSVS